MGSSERYFDPKALARLGRLELRARSVVEGIVSGLHRSPYNGQSVEFVDHRPYVPGDDPRHIDWKVWGRADRIVIKRYEEDTNLRGHVLLDSSESMRYGGGNVDARRGEMRRGGFDARRGETRRGVGGLSKYDYGGTLAASLAWLLHGQHDAVSLSLFDSKVRASVPLSTRKVVLRQIADAVESTPPAQKTGIGGVLRDLAQTLPRRGLVVIISDLFAPVEDLAEGLAELRVRRQETIVFQLLDETELTFPFEGNTLFKGLEAYPDLMVEPRSLRDAYLEALRRFLGRVGEVCAGLGVDYRLVSTAEPIDVPIVSVAAARARAGRRSW
jgi:uncharacterized protein (DUF58 family)